MPDMQLRQLLLEHPVKIDQLITGIQHFKSLAAETVQIEIVERGPTTSVALTAYRYVPDTEELSLKIDNAISRIDELDERMKSAMELIYNKQTPNS